MDRDVRAPGIGGPELQAAGRTSSADAKHPIRGFVEFVGAGMETALRLGEVFGVQLSAVTHAGYVP